MPGNLYMFKVAAFNSNGVTYSEATRFVVGDIPPSPVSAPQPLSGGTLKLTYVIRIGVAEVTVDSSTTPVIRSYSIEIDDG